MPTDAARPHLPAGREPAAEDADRRLVAALRRGDDAAFAALLDRYHAPLVRLASLYVADPAVAEEVIQETWLGVLRGIDRFEGRSSFKTWLCRILTNLAKRRGAREARTVPFSALSRPGADGAGPAVDPGRFLPPGDAWAGHWAGDLRDWGRLPEEALLAQEALAHVRRAIAALPPNQRLVVTMRDVEGWTAGEVCGALAISEANQRVLLHRARSGVRRALERYLEGASP